MIKIKQHIAESFPLDKALINRGVAANVAIIIAIKWVMALPGSFSLLIVLLIQITPSFLYVVFITTSCYIKYYSLKLLYASIICLFTDFSPNLILILYIHIIRWIYSNIPYSYLKMKMRTCAISSISG